MMKQQEVKMEEDYKPSISFRALPVTIQLLLIVVSALNVKAQVNDSLAVNKKRLTTFTIGAATTYGITLIGLNHLWYRNTERQSFRFFNDNAEWKQVDKLGHSFSAFYFSYGTSKALRWCNVAEKKANLAGALTGFMVLVPIEIFDGYSDAYGASSGDLIANTVGSSFFLGQKFLWGEVRINPKFSTHSTSHAAIRPEVLGDNAWSEIIKNYNGQTYWLSADLDKFMPFPKWLNLAVGYGAQEMVYARDSQNRMAGYEAFRQYYVSIDFDITAIRTRSKVLKTLIFIANTIKIPAPAIELSRKKIIFHSFYF